MGALRRIAASYWTALVLGLAAVVLHVRWYTVDKAPGPEVLSGLGAALVVLGVLVASRPYFRAGWTALIAAAQPKRMVAFLGGKGDAQRHRERVAAERPQVVGDVLAERVVGVVLALLGTLLNGYGPLVARLLHLRGS